MAIGSLRGNENFPRISGPAACPDTPLCLRDAQPPTPRLAAAETTLLVNRTQLKFPPLAGPGGQAMTAVAPPLGWLLQYLDDTPPPRLNAHNALRGFDRS